MGASVDAVFVETFERTVRHLAQQSVTRLRPWVVERAVHSEAHNWERLGSREAIQKEERLQETPSQDYPWSRRKSEPLTFNTGDDTEQEDIVQMLVDPNSNIAIAQGKAMRRALDNEIIKAAVGDSRDGEGNIVEIPVGQTIGVEDTPVPMTFDLVTQVSEIFMDNDIDPDEAKVFVISPRQARKLLQLTEATSGDYNALRPLTSKGYIESWMGYSWLVSTLLPDSSSQVNDSENFIFAMTRRALGLQMNKDIWVRIAEDPSFSFVWRIYCASTYGAIRVEDEQLVRINCSTTI